MNQSLEVCGGLICIDITCEEKIHKHGGRTQDGIRNGIRGLENGWPNMHVT